MTKRKKNEIHNQIISPKIHTRSINLPPHLASCMSRATPTLSNLHNPKKDHHAELIIKGKDKNGFTLRLVMI